MSATGTACASGTCVVSGANNFPGTYQAGTCSVECQNGATQCVNGGGGSFQTCTNGLWGASQECAMGTNCFDTLGTNGLPSHACGDCNPGTHQCGATNAVIETCGANGTWGPDTACTVGICETLVSDAACIVQCFPGKPVCIGNHVTVPGVGVGATDTQATCSATGTIPASGTACTAGQYCRTGPTTGTIPGNSYGCVVCVGANNEFGLPDTRCENVGDSGAGEYVEQCLANNSGWDITDHVLCSGDNPTCQSPSTNTPIPPTTGLYCHTLSGLGPVTDSSLAAFGATCANLNMTGLDTTTACPLASGGAVGDCCTDFCKAGDPVPNPAFCN